MPVSNDYAKQYLDFLLAKITTLTAPDRVWAGLSSNDPEKDKGTFNELSGGGYARVLISIRGETYPDIIGPASDRAITNAYQLNWPKATLDWIVKGIGLFSAPSGGSPFFYGAIELTEDQIAAGGLIVEAGAVALFDPQTFKISFPVTDTTETTASE